MSAPAALGPARCDADLDPTGETWTRRSHPRRTRRMRALARVLVSVLTLIGLAGPAQAAPGNLDTSFSSDGKIVESSLAPSHAGAVAIQADGKIVVAGSTGNDFAVLRYHRN